MIDGRKGDEGEIRGEPEEKTIEEATLPLRISLLERAANNLGLSDHSIQPTEDRINSIRISPNVVNTRSCQEKRIMRWSFQKKNNYLDTFTFPSPTLESLQKKTTCP